MKITVVGAAVIAIGIILVILILKCMQENGPTSGETN